MNIQLNLSLDIVNTVLTSLGQLQAGTQNAIAAIQQQAKEQLAPADETAADQKVGGTD